MARSITNFMRFLCLISLIIPAANAVASPGTRAETITIGVGSELTKFIEAQPLIDQSRELQTQIIYLAGEIGMPGDITSLEFPGLIDGTLDGTRWTIRMKPTDMPGFIRRWVSDRGKWRKVYEGPIRTLPQGRGLRFELDRPYEFDGIRNILIEISVKDVPPQGEIPLECFRSPWARSAYRVVGLLPSLPPSGDAGQLAGGFRIMRLVPNVAIGMEPTEGQGPIAASFPFHEGFESGTLPGWWETYRYVSGGSTDSDLIEVTQQCQPYEGDLHLRMTITGSGEGALAAAILTIDLAGRENAVLRFRHRWFDAVEGRQIPCEPGKNVAETAPLNGVAISEDGQAWVAAIGLMPDIAGPDAHQYLEYVVDLDEAARQAGMKFNSRFKIRFQYGITYFTCVPRPDSKSGCSTPCNIDPGVVFDDIAIESGNPPPQVLGITPASGADEGTLAITDLSGAGFIHGARVKLVRDGQQDIAATDCIVLGSGRITCEIPLEGAAVGPWDVVVTNTADALSGTLVRGFTVTDATLETIAIGDPDDGVLSEAGAGFFCKREQAIYAADEIGRAGTIMEIAFMLNGPPARTWKTGRFA